MGRPDEDGEDFVDRIAAAVAARLGPRSADIGTRLDEVFARLDVLASRLEAPPVAPAVLPGAGMTWAEIWPLYWEAEHGQIASWKAYRSAGKHIVRLLGDRLVMESSIATVRWYRSKRKTEPIEGGRGKGHLPQPKTIDNEVIVLRRVLRWASRQRPPLIPSDPLGMFDSDELLESAPNVRLNVVDDDPEAPLALAQFLQHGDELDRAMVLIAHSSGMRRREIALFDMSWLDLRPGLDGKPLRLVMIPPGVSKGRRGKRKGRITMISMDALSAIEEYRRTLPLPLQRRGGPVLVNAATERAYHPDTLTSRFRDLQELAGASGPSGPVWLHDLRRSFITLTRRRGEDAVNVMLLVGHTTLESQERYHVRSLQEAINIRDRIEAARALELSSLAKARRGPKRSAAVDNHVGVEIKSQLRFSY